MPCDTIPHMQISNPSNQGKVVGGFLKQVRDELNQVTWPTKQHTLRLTTMVIVVSLLVGTYLGLLDYLLTKLMGIII